MVYKTGGQTYLEIVINSLKLCVSNYNLIIQMMYKTMVFLLKFFTNFLNPSFLGIGVYEANCSIFKIIEPSNYVIQCHRVSLCFRSIKMNLFQNDLFAIYTSVEKRSWNKIIDLNHWAPGVVK